MTVFPDLTPYYVDDDQEIRRRMNAEYQQNITLQQQAWNEMDIDTRFHAGDQTLWNQIYGTLPLQNRRTFQFNRIRRIINLITGYQRRNRKSTIVTPIENADQETSDQLSKVLQWTNNNGRAYDTISDAFQGACITGLNLISVWMDYRSDPVNGDIRFERKSYNGIMVDPTFKKKDLSDANSIWTRKWMSKKQIVSLLPERKKEIEAMPYTANRDEKFIFLPENYQLGIQGLLPYDEYWYLDYRPAKLLVDVESGDTKEWEGEEKALKEYLRYFPQIQAVDIQKQTCKLAICVGNRVMYNGPNPYGIDRYPFVGVFGYFEPEIPYFALKMQGVVRGLRDAQFLYNRKQVICNDILESQINSGLKYKESALIDPNDAFLVGQGRALALRDSASMDDVQVIQPPGIQQSMMDLMKSLGDEIGQISGVNEELLGSATDDKAGILSQLRQGAGLTTLQILFDQLDESQEQLGSLTLDLIKANFSKGKIQRILGEDKEVSEQFTSKAFQKYDCNVEEGIMTTSQKQMQFIQLMNLREAGLPIPDSVLIEAAQLQDKKKLTDALKAQADEQKQVQDAQTQAQLQQVQVLTESMQAKAQSDRALAEERINKIGLDAALNVERIARAQEDRDQGNLAKIKAAKELESMDLNHLREMLAILESLQEGDKLKSPPVEQSVRPQPMQQRQMTGELQNVV
jgi:hypothetical protein